MEEESEAVKEKDTDYLSLIAQMMLEDKNWCNMEQRE